MKHFKLDKRKLIKWLTSPALWLTLLPLMMMAPNIALSITEYNSVFAKLVNIVLPLGLYTWLAGASTRAGKVILCFIPLMIFASFQIVLLYLYGESVISIDMYMNVVTTSVGEVTELLGNLWLAIITVLLLYLPLIVMGIYFLAKHKFATPGYVRLLRRWGRSITAVGLAMMLVALAVIPTYSARRELFPYNAIENLFTAISRTHESINYHKTSDSFSYHASLTRNKEDKEVYVLVIGETSRADNWSLLGYDRETNPRLSKRDGVVALPRVLSEINTTHKSVPMLLSYLSSTNFGDSIAHTRSIIQAFNEVGYQTGFISNQSPNHSYNDYFGLEAGVAMFLANHGSHHFDGELLTPMKRIVANSSSNKVFIVLHTYGSHFEYIKRYPAESAVFTPDHNSTASFANRDELLNAYDNSIVYTDGVLDDIIDYLSHLKAKTAMVYVSDHGEDIFDDARKRFLHSSPTATYYQLHVPMVVWMSDSLKSEYPMLSENLVANHDKDVSSSVSLFHTILDLAGLKSPYYDSRRSLFSAKYQPAPRRYLSDHNESLDFEHCGLRQLDIEKMHEMGISTK
jgi:glucan phosphoethanolaminetransferase (alkaline phosphatase superfamily)